MTQAATGNTLDVNEAYSECEKIIWKIVTRFAGASRFDKDELYSVAAEKFVKVVGQWDPDKGSKLTTYIQMRIEGRLKTFVTRNSKRFSKEVSCGDFSEMGLNPEDTACRATILETVEELSLSAKTLALLVLNPPAQLIEDVQTPTKFRKNLKVYATTELGWSPEEYKSAFREAQSTIEQHREVGTERF